MTDYVHDVSAPPDPLDFDSPADYIAAYDEWYALTHYLTLFRLPPLHNRDPGDESASA